MGSYRNDSKLIAFFGRLSYNFRDKYFATFSLRHEGSSKFGVSNKWGSFPAVSAGWRISEEDFIKNILLKGGFFCKEKKMTKKRENPVKLLDKYRFLLAKNGHIW